MNTSLPDPAPSDDELDEVIRHYGKPSGHELEQSLKQRLEQAKQRYLKRQHNLLRDQERNREGNQRHSR